MTEKDVIDWARRERDLAIGILSLRTKCEECESQVKRLRLALMQQVAGEQDGKGKAKYGNADARQAEALKREENHEDLRRLIETTDMLKYDIRSKEIEQHYAENMLKIGIAFPETVFAALSGEVTA